MTTQYFCKNRDRWKKIRENNLINGIDYLEVSSEDQKTLRLYFLHNLPHGVPEDPPGMTVPGKDNIFIEGGVRIKSISVVKAIPDAVQKNALTIVVDQAGDYSLYTLKLGNSPTDHDTPLAGYDVILSSVEFSFRVNCPAEFDCKTETYCTTGDNESLSGDYLAKDYASFNRLMLDRLSVLMPGWKERHAADLQVAMVELLAYVGDHLSYFQDAVGTEAYLRTARRRISLRRHARLLDYTVHDGCNARAWIQIEVVPGGGAEGKSLEKGTQLMTNGDEGKAWISASEREKFISEREPVVFETMHNITLHSNRNTVSFYTWEDNNCCLPAGATRASLQDKIPPLSLQPGDLLVFEEMYSPQTGESSDKDPERRHTVRLKRVQSGVTDPLNGKKVVNIEWYENDALPFPLCLTSSVENKDTLLQLNEKSVARGNVVLADQGETVTGERLIPASAVEDEEFYPQLPGINITLAVPYNHSEQKGTAASLVITQDPHEALPAVSLTEAGDAEIWEARRDLLGSDRFANEFVVETERDGTSFIRFGNNISGRKPPNGFEPEVTFRMGNGREGNAGAEAVNTIVLDGGGISKIRNPMSATGGIDAETMEEIRQFAPQAFRTQERAVTAEDYAEKTGLHPEVQKATARFYWTGSWYTVFIIIDRKEGKEIDSAFKQEIIRHLEKYRMAGYDLEIRGPRYVPLSILLNVCVKEGYFRSNIKKSLLEAFSSNVLPDGTRGFFHPDNFTFGQPVYLSTVYQKAMSIEGVESVEVEEFQRWAEKPAQEIKNGLIKPSELEIIRLNNDPNFPENGKIDFNLFGGL